MTSEVRSTIVNTMGPILGLAIGLAILGIVAGLSILPSGTSAGIISAVVQINSFLVLVGVAIAVGVALYALSKL